MALVTQLSLRQGRKMTNKELRTSFEAYVTETAYRNPTWTQEEIQEEANQWIRRHGLAPGAFALPFDSPPKCPDDNPEWREAR